MARAELVGSFLVIDAARIRLAVLEHRVHVPVTGDHPPVVEAVVVDRVVIAQALVAEEMEVRQRRAEQLPSVGAVAGYANVKAPDALEDSVRGLGEQVSHLQQLSDARRDFVTGNIKARIRMVAQFAIANANNGLVIGTDHAAEAVMGFFTKFGDGACDLAPLSGLVKGQVRAIAKHLGAPENLVFKVPTADLEELRPGKPDEEAHGVTYAEIDAFLHGEPVRQEAFDIIVNTYNKTHHKRVMPFAP